MSVKIPKVPNTSILKDLARLLPFFSSISNKGFSTSKHKLRASVSPLPRFNSGNLKIEMSLIAIHFFSISFSKIFPSSFRLFGIFIISLYKALGTII